jgi:hypothetical protein
MADWSDNEVDLIIADYFAMLSDELEGRKYNKSQHRKQLIKLLDERSNGSIEFKHQNITAVLRKLGLPFIKGYKYRSNYQHILEDKVIDHLKTQKQILEPKFLHFAEEAPNIIGDYNFKNIIAKPPIKKNIVAEPEIEYSRKPIKINYLEREQNNSSLGEQGERLVLKYEKWHLIQNGKESLADKIEWISPNDDGAGFDILSKNLNGTDKYIEVKTTKLSKETPLFFSKNEYEFSKEKSKDYNLYRVFDFSKKPKIFFLNGDFDSFCNKEAIQFKGYF